MRIWARWKRSLVQHRRTGNLRFQAGEGAWGAGACSWMVLTPGPDGHRPSGVTRAPGKELEGGDTKLAVPGFPGGAVVENLPANAGDAGLSPGLGRSHMPRSN